MSAKIIVNVYNVNVLCNVTNHVQIVMAIGVFRLHLLELEKVSIKKSLFIMTTPFFRSMNYAEISPTDIFPA